jgi:hypothetical protein
MVLGPALCLLLSACTAVQPREDSDSVPLSIVAQAPPEPPTEPDLPDRRPIPWIWVREDPEYWDRENPDYY